MQIKLCSDWSDEDVLNSSSSAIDIDITKVWNSYEIDIRRLDPRESIGITHQGSEVFEVPEPFTPSSKEADVRHKSPSWKSFVRTFLHTAKSRLKTPDPLALWWLFFIVINLDPDWWHVFCEGDTFIAESQVRLRIFVGCFWKIARDLDFVWNISIFLELLTKSLEFFSHPFRYQIGSGISYNATIQNWKCFQSPTGTQHWPGPKSQCRTTTPMQFWLER